MPVGPRRTSRLWLGALGLAVACVAWWIPDSLYHPLPQRDQLAAPAISGWLLFRLCLACDAALLLWFAWRPWTRRPIVPEERVRVSPVPHEIHVPGTAWWVAAITAIALVLRLIALGSDLWLDEIAPLLLYDRASAWQVATSYISGSNHLLNTLLVKLSIGVFGQSEWAVRLPAVIFGTASVPALFWIARRLLSVGASLGAALLLAVSYHHILFSQSARGYSAFLFFALLSSGMLAWGLTDDRRRVWAGYATTIVLGLASLLVTGFVLAGHMLVGVAALIQIKRRGGTAGPMLRRLAVVFSLTAWLCLHLYVVVLPTAYVYMRTVYVDPALGFGSTSLELVHEIFRAVSAGFGPGMLLAALPVLAIVAAGYRLLLRRHWPLALALAVPLAVQAAFVLAGGLVVLPRTFILVLPVAVLAVVAGISLVANWTSAALNRGPSLASRVTAIAIAAIVTLSLLSLPSYYRTPKQSYRAALEHVESLRASDDLVIVAHYARGGGLYYTRRLGLAQDRYLYAATREQFDGVMASHPGRRVWVISTFPRALRVDQPELDRRIRDGWTIVRTFPATIGDGQVFVWAPR